MCVEHVVEHVDVMLMSKPSLLVAMSRADWQ